ncbi:hypothetical protein HD554DRAFT_2040055 [Boletus coccyginus]|nr:hypothetical protein HD554DRAFT_2040055 [Boletus coccyginus]
MPLETVPDPFDDATNNELDRAVEKAVNDDLADVSDLCAHWQYVNVLNAIIENGKDMDRKYLSMTGTRNLIKTHEELRAMLASAWKRKSFREIRNLAILRAPQSESKPSTPTPTASTDTLEDLHHNLSGSFGAKYRGAAVDGFYEYLTRNEKLFKTVSNPKYYARFCSIVQSSGTGKSRTLTEEYLSTGHRNDKASVMRWVRQMCDMSDPPGSTARADFFREVSKRYSKVHTNLIYAFKRRPSATLSIPDRDVMDDEAAGTGVDTAADKLSELALSDNSDRVAVSGQKLFPPYTQLGWDQSALGLGEIDIEDVSRVHHIVVSLKTALTLPGRVLDTASAKLCGGDEFDASNMDHVIEVLGQRFGLNVTFGHPDSVEHLESGVASHLRICLATTLDRNWRFTSYPSEPLLSCVAARSLHAVPGKLKVALGTLLNAVNSGMIDVGQRGELASRLLWLLAKDLFVRTETKVVNNIPSSWDEHLIDCQMIPVVDWLEFIFGTHMWNADDNQASLAHDMFKDAYINFSHWVCMEANIAGSNEGNELRLEQWTLRHWQRTSAVQCCHQQPVIDKAIPIYFKGGPEGASTDSKKALHGITRRHENLRGKDGTSDPDSDPLPYIAILADLGQPSSFSLTFPERNADDRCLRIYAAGVDTVTYPFLGRYPAIMDALQDLVHLQQIPETETPCEVREHCDTGTYVMGAREAIPECPANNCRTVVTESITYVQCETVIFDVF